MPSDLLLALDKSVRFRDDNGYLHVGVNNISKAVVNPYLGKEIPGSDGMGLNQEQVYQLLRHPDELAKSAPTFNNIPLLSQHIPVSIDDPPKESVVGSTGTDAEFKAPYLRNSIVVWDEAAIVGIESRDQVELSCGYRYEADMTPGTFDGVAYDGVMRNIKGNHVALVSAGRAGPDVVVGDSAIPLDSRVSARSANPEGSSHSPKEGLMAKTKHNLSPQAHAVRGALAGVIRPRLAAGKTLAMDELGDIVKNVTGQKFKSQKAGIAGVVKQRFSDRLAQDADLEDIMDLLDNLEDGMEGYDAVPPADPAAPAVDASPVDVHAVLAPLFEALEQKILELVAGGAAPKPPAVDGKECLDGFPPKADPAGVAKPAMDAAIALAVKEAEQNTVARLTKLSQAQRDVAPLVGEVAGMDTAESVYKFALDSAGIDTKDIHPSAFGALVAQLKQGQRSPAPIAQDQAAVGSFAERFPKAGRVQVRG